MFGWRRHRPAPSPPPPPSPPVSQRDVLARWKAEAAKSPYTPAIALGVAEPATSMPYALAITDADGVPDWVAPCTRVAGNVLIAWDQAIPGLSLPDPSGASVYDAFIADLRRLSRWIVPLSDTVWLVGTTRDITTIHRDLGDQLGVMSRSLTVVDLFTGRAIGWDARRGLMTMVEPARPQED